MVCEQLAKQGGWDTAAGAAPGVLRRIGEGLAKGKEWQVSATGVAYFWQLAWGQQNGQTHHQRCLDQWDLHGILEEEGGVEE